MFWWGMQSEWVYMRDTADAAARIRNYDYAMQMAIAFNFMAIES